MLASWRTTGLCLTCHFSPSYWSAQYRLRLQAFLDDGDMLPATQSAYLQFHSTESAVLKFSDLLLAADSGQVSALCLLDSTAAFDTVDHDLLMLRQSVLSVSSVSVVLLQWFRSYLSDRSFRVVLSTSTSFLVHLFCSVPQGSVLGPHVYWRILLTWFRSTCTVICRPQTRRLYLWSRPLDVGQSPEAERRLDRASLCVCSRHKLRSRGVFRGGPNRRPLNSAKFEIWSVDSRENH